MATQDTTNNRTSSNVELQGFAGGEDGIRGEVIPQLPSVVAQCQFWWKFSMWPIVFLGANTTVYSALMLDESAEERDGLRNLCVLTVVLWLDAIALYKAAKVVERQIIAMESDSEVSSPSSLSHLYVYARVSKMAEKFLSSGHSAHDVAFFVNLLLLAFTIVMSASLLTVVFGVLINGLGRDFFGCLDDAIAPPKGMNNSAVPVVLQLWASGHGNYEEVSYIHLADGTTFFVGQNTTNGSRAYLGMVMGNGTYKFYSDVEIVKGFHAVGNYDGHNFPSGMCSITRSHYNGFDRYGGVKTGLLCYSSYDKMLRNTTMPEPDFQGEYYVQGLNDSVWLRALYYSSGDFLTGIYSLDYENMKWNNVVESETYSKYRTPLISRVLTTLTGWKLEFERWVLSSRRSGYLKFKAYQLVWSHSLSSSVSFSQVLAGAFSFSVVSWEQSVPRPP
jgi:hypothetical protein